MPLLDLRQLRARDSGVVQQVLVEDLPLALSHHVVHLLLRHVPPRHLQLPDNKVLAALLLAQQALVVLQQYLDRIHGEQARGGIRV